MFNNTATFALVFFLQPPVSVLAFRIEFFTYDFLFSFSFFSSFFFFFFVPSSSNLGQVRIPRSRGHVEVLMGAIRFHRFLTGF